MFYVKVEAYPRSYTLAVWIQLWSDKEQKGKPMVMVAAEKIEPEFRSEDRAGEDQFSQCDR